VSKQPVEPLTPLPDREAVSLSGECFFLLFLFCFDGNSPLPPPKKNPQKLKKREKEKTEIKKVGVVTRVL
jgi:hypothetical protein